MDSNIIPIQQNAVVSLLDSVDLTQVQTLLNKVTQFQAIVQKTLKPEHDFGVIPGTGKPTLLKPGAEKILMLMGLTSEYDIAERIEDYEKGIFAYTVKCTLLKNGQKITEGFGSCNSKEDKYRWRMVDEKDLPNGIDKDNLKQKTNKYGQTKYRIENDDTCSLANTILKMAKKRAQIDASLTVGSLSDVFTQDVEDMKQFLEEEQTTSMDANSAKNIKLNFGKHKGKTLEEVFKEAPDYIEWLVGNEKTDPVIKKACELLVNGNKQQPHMMEKEQKEAIFDMAKAKGLVTGEGKNANIGELKKFCMKAVDVPLSNLTYDNANDLLGVLAAYNNDLTPEELETMDALSATGLEDTPLA